MLVSSASFSCSHPSRPHPGGYPHPVTAPTLPASHGPCASPHRRSLSAAWRIALLAVALAATPGPALANDTIEKVVKGLTESPVGSEAFKAAQELAKTLTAEQAATAATQIKDKLIGDANVATDFVIKLYDFGNSKGPNPFVKALGGPLSTALQAQLGNLFTVFKDPETNAGQLFLKRALEDLGVPEDQAGLIADKAAERARNERLAREAAGRALSSESGNTLFYDAGTGGLSLTDDKIVSVLLLDGSVDLTDSLVGADVLIPTFTFDGFTPEGAASFVPNGDGMLRITKDGDVLLATFLRGLLYENGTFAGASALVTLAGVPPSSPFFGGLTGPPSAFLASLDAILQTEPAPRFALAIEFTPNADIGALTQGWTSDGSTGYKNMLFPYEYAAPIPEPASLALVGAGLAILGASAARRRTAARG